jgi:RHS repeat-associated protein
MHNVVVEDGHGQHFRLHLSGEAPIVAPIQHKEFRDAQAAQTFVRGLRYSADQWRRVLHQIDTGRRSYLNDKHIYEAVGASIVQGRIKVYPVAHLSQRGQSVQYPLIQASPGIHYRFIPASVLLVKSLRDVTIFRNKADAERFLQSLNLNDAQIETIVNAHSSTAANGSVRNNAAMTAALIEKLATGEIVVAKEIQSAAPPNTGSSETFASSNDGTKVATLGPHAGAGTATPPVRTDASKPVTTAATVGDPAEPVCKGEPISMISGEELLTLEDFALTGPVPFVWKRIYRTSHSRDIGLGHGWVHPGQAYLTLKADSVELMADDGRLISFKRPAQGRKSKQLHEGMTLAQETDHCFVLTQAGQPSKVFERISEQTYRLCQWRHKAYVPAKKTTANATGESARGYALDFHYDTTGRLQRVQGNWGRGLVFKRNPQGRIAAIHQTDHDGEPRDTATVRYTYDDAGDLIAHHNASGHGEQYRYTNHIIVQRTLATGANFFFEWDQLNNLAKCQRQWGDHGNYAYAFKWDPDNQTSAATDSLGNTTRFRYNQFGLITEETDPDGHVHRKDYNDAGQVIAAIDPLGNKTEYLYDDQQHLLRVTNPLGQRTQLNYAGDELTHYIDAAGQTWKRQYNAQGLVQRVTDPRGNTSRYEYTPHGLISAVIDAAGRTTRYTWNDRAELLTQKDPLGNTLHYGYDAWGQVTQVIAQAAGQALEHAKKSPSRYDYTLTGLIAKVTNAAEQVTRFAYNENDQLTNYTDAHGRETQYFYDDKLRQPTRRIDPAGHVVRYEYDTERNLTALINENGDKHQFFYDGNERLIKEIGFDGRTQHYQYNAAGHLIQHLDSGVVITEFQRNALGQLETKASRLVGDDKDAPRERARYRYDAVGQLVETYNAHQFLQFHYDPLGHVTQESHCDLNEARQQLLSTQRITAHQYNALGQRTHTTLPDGQTIRYDYDTSLAFAAVAVNDQIITTVQRDSLGREVSRAHGALTTHTDYDPQGRLQKQATVHKDSQHAIIHREYGYDQFSNLNFVKDGTEETKYVYDTVNRLKLAANASPEFFDFDPAGNLLSITDTPKATPGLVKGNRLLIQGDKKFSYDLRGNLIKEARGKDGKLEKRFTYDLNNQLIAVIGQQRDQSVTFKYDPLGRRLEKRDAFGATRYLWVDNLLTQETRNTISKTYIYEPGSFRPLAQVQDNQVYHYHLDHLGTPRELTNDDGKIVWKAKYKTYGNLALKEVEEVENNLRFQGQYFDEETGLHYNRFRYYSPNTGQFINQDPIGLLGGLNNYQYAANPIAWIDPMGLTCKEYKTEGLKPGFYGENDPNNPNRWNAGQTVKYLSNEERGVFELDVKNGLLVNKQTGVPFDTSASNTLWGGAIFVMDPQGKIFASNSQVRGEFHHSSLLAGQPVAAAGTLSVENGKLLSVSNQSGHYQPSQKHNNQLFEELEKKGVDSKQLDKVERTGWKDNGNPMNPKKHGDFRQAENWKPGDELADDWMDF